MFEFTTDRLRLLEAIRREREFLLQALAGLTPAEMEAPGTLGAWSIKGLLAHLTYHEETYLAAVDCGARGGTPQHVPYGQPDEIIDAINAEAHEAARDRPLADVLADFEAAYTRVLDHVFALSDAQLFTPGLYPWMGDLTLRDMLVANTCDHYHEHAVQVRQWRASRELSVDSQSSTVVSKDVRRLDQP